MSVAQQQQPVVHTTTQQQQHINHHHQQEQHHSSTTTNNQQQLQLQQEQRQKLLNKRKLVIQEIFQTEKEYVNALETLDNIFITPIKQQQLLKEEDTNELFKDIQIILAVNKEVLSFIDIFIKYMEDHNYNDDDLNNTLNTLNSSNNNGNNSVGGVGSSSVSVGGNTLEVNNNSNNNNNTISPSTPTTGNDFTSSFSNNSQPTTPTTNNTSNTTNTNTTNTSNTTNSNSNNNKEIEQKKRNALILGKKITPTLGDIFHLMSDYLKSYSSYCNKYELIFKMIEEKKQKKSKFRKFLERTEFTPDAFNDSIISFMIKPVQRIPRYEMLLRESIKTTPQDHHDYSRLISAAQKINNVASRVNEKIREQLCRERAIQLSQQFNSDQLPFELVKSSRKFIAHTVMGYISDRSGIQMRCFILYNDLILLCNYTGSSNSNSNNNSNNNSNSTSNSTDQMMTQFFNNSNNSNNTSNSNTNNNNTNNLTNITNINETYSNEQKKKEVEIFDNPKVKFHLRCAISLLSTPLIWAESLPDGYCIENAFKLVTRDKTFILFTENKIQRDYWVQLINDQMDKLKKQLPHLNEESNANEIMLVNSRYFYYASGNEKDKRIEMLNSQMSDSSERLKIETSLQQDHLNLIIEQIQKDVDFIDQQCYDHEYVQSMNYLKLQPSHPLSNSHSQHRLSVNSLNNTCLSPSIDDINNNSNGSGNSLLSNLNSSSASNLITTSAAAAANNSSNSNSSSSISQSKRNSTSIKSLFSGGSANSNATTPTSSVATSPVSVSHGNSLSLSNLYDHHGAHSPSSSYGSSPPVYLSPSNNALSPSHHQTGHLSASIALRSSSTSTSTTTTNRDRSNSLYNTRIVIPQQRNSQSPTILKELFQKLNTDFQDQELSTSTSNSTSNNMTTSTSSISSSNNTINSNNNTNNNEKDSFTKKLTVKMMSKFKKSGQKKKIQDTDQMLYLSDGEGEVDEPFSTNLLSYMQDITRRRIDMQYFDEFIKLHEKHAKQFDPLIQELQFGSKPQHNVDRLLRRKVSEINYDNSNQQEDAISYMSGGMSGGMSDNHRFSVCSVNDNEINTSTEITVSSPTTTSLLDSSNNNNNTIINEYSNDDNNDNNNNNNTTDNSAVLYHSNSTLSNNSTSDNNNLFSTITEQLIKLNPNRVTPLVKEHVIEEIGNTKYTTLVFNPLYGLKDLPTTRKYRLQYIDEFKDWNESSVNDEYSNFLKNFSDKFGIPNEINTSSSPSRSSNADKSNPYNNNNNNTNSTTTTENDKKRRSLFFWK